MFKVKVVCLSGLVLVVLVLSPLTVLAEESGVGAGPTRAMERRETAEERQASRQQDLADQTAEFCNRATVSLSERSTRFSQNQTLLMKFYGQIQQAVQVLIDQKQAKGEGTTELVSYQTQLNAKIVALTTAAAAYQQAMTNTQTLNCTTDREAFRTSLRQMNQAMREFNTARQSLHTFVRTKLYPMVNRMRLSKLSPTVLPSPTPNI